MPGLSRRSTSSNSFKIKCSIDHQKTDMCFESKYPLAHANLLTLLRVPMCLVLFLPADRSVQVERGRFSAASYSIRKSKAGG